MKQNIIKFVAAIVIVLVAVVVNEVSNSGVQTAGGPSGKSLKEQNEALKTDTTKTKTTIMAQANTTSEGENLAQVTMITNWEYQHGIFFSGIDFIGTVSTQFGVMAPTVDARVGVDFNACRLELKAGNFTCNGVTTGCFDPQFANNCILWGESASVNNAVQLSLIGKTAKIYCGHQGGEKFYSFCDGNYYVGAEQKIKNVSLSGGVNFTEQTTGYAAAKWSAKNNTVTFTGNKIGSEDQNFVVSYVRNGISLGKGVHMSLGNALYFQPEKSGWQLVTGFNKGKITLFAETGGYIKAKTFTPMGGLGFNYNL